MDKIIFSGASISNSPWPTWVDFIKERYYFDFISTCKKGQGNESIILRALESAWKNQDSQSSIRIMIMLTSVDKWDWYVDDPELIKKYDKEKHNITRFNEKDEFGFWCTGSWFPLEKQIFKDRFYSEDYFTLKTIQLILMFVEVCRKNSWKYDIFYDSPIWSITEQELTESQGKDININSDELIKTNLTNWLYQSGKLDDITHKPGLIGYLYENNLPWFSQKYGIHPGPLSHFEFTKAHIFPRLDGKYVEKESIKHLEKFAKRMESQWK